jgi:hypothetical protein
VNTDPVRDEAERLVAAAIAALSVASRSLPGLGARSGFATGSEECCVCPVCRAIAAMREPDPEFAERLATGAADLATGVAGLLRSLSRPTGGRSDREPWSDREPRSEGAPWSDDVGPAPAGGPDPWHEATTAPPPEPAPAKKPMAKKAVKKAAAKATPPAKAAKKATKKATKNVAKKAAKKAQPE